MIPNSEQRKILMAWGLPVGGALVLLALPLLPIGLDVLVGTVGMSCAAIGGFKFRGAAA